MPLLVPTILGIGGVVAEDVVVVGVMTDRGDADDWRRRYCCDDGGGTRSNLCMGEKKGDGSDDEDDDIPDIIAAGLGGGFFRAGPRRRFNFSKMCSTLRLSGMSAWVGYTGRAMSSNRG